MLSSDTFSDPRGGALAVRVRIALLILAVAAASPASAQSGCSGGSGSPITISNFKAGETLGYDLVLLKGTATALPAQVILTSGGQSTAWPTVNGMFKGFVRLIPGVNKVVISATGSQNACLELTYMPNAFATQLRMALILPKDYVEGGGLFPASVGEPADLASFRKRAGFAALLLQSLTADLLVKAGKTRLAPHIARDGNGDPDMLILNSDKTRAELDANQSVQAITFAQSALKPHRDGRTRFLVFYPKLSAIYDLDEGVLFPLNDFYAWPQDLSELVASFTDTRTPGQAGVPGAIQTASMAEILRNDFGLFFRRTGRWVLDVPAVDTVTVEPYGKGYPHLNTIFMTKTELGVGITEEKCALTSGSANALTSGDWLVAPNPAKLPALTGALVPANLVQGVDYKYYEGGFDKLPDFATFSPAATGIASGINIANRKRDDNIGFVFDAYLKVAQSGLCLFQLRSDDGSRLILDGQSLITYDGLHVDAPMARGTALDAGLHRIQIQYFNKDGDRGLEVLWAGPTAPMQAIASAALLRPNTPSALRPHGSHAGRSLLRSGNGLVLSLGESRKVTLTRLAPDGRYGGNVFSGILPAGDHRFTLPVAARGDQILIR